MQSDEIVSEQGSDLRGYLHVLARRKWVVVLVAVVAVGLSVAYSLVKTPIYSASTTVLVPEQQPNSALNIQNSFLPASDVLIRELSDDAQFARGDTVKADAAKILGYQAGVTVGTSVTADVITFTAHSTDKAAAAQIANAYASAFITARRTNQVTQYTQQITALEASIAKLQAQVAALPPGSSQLPALRQSILSLTQTVQQNQAASEVAGQVGPAVIKAAVTPSSPSSPRPVRNGILALIAGLIIGIGAAFVVERLDDGINSREAAEEGAEGLPIVGLIPMVDAWKAKGSHHLALVEDPTSSVAEAYRTLRTAIQFLGIDEPKRVIAVTSAVPDEGKTTAVANLAVSFARAGLRVIVVSCDLRRPKLHDFFGDSDRSGLTTVLLGHCTLNEGVHAVKDEPRLRVMPSGPVPPNPAEILSLDRVAEIVNLLADNSDLVLIDCPPVLPVTDALLLSRLADGMLVLAAAKSTSKRDLRRTIELLRQVHAPLMGLVLNRVPVDGGYAYGYGYGYYAKYDGTEETATNGKAAEFETLVAHGSSKRSNAAETPPAETSPARVEPPSPSGRLFVRPPEAFDQ